MPRSHPPARPRSVGRSESLLPSDRRSADHLPSACRPGARLPSIRVPSIRVPPTRRRTPTGLTAAVLGALLGLLLGSGLAGCAAAGGTAVGGATGPSRSASGASPSGSATSGPAPSGSSTPSASASRPRTTVAPSAAYPVQVVRSGGFAGVFDLVQITADHFVSVQPTRRDRYTCRLTPAEASALDQLLSTADWARAPRPIPAVADGFDYEVSSPLGGPKAVLESTFGPGAPALIDLVEHLVNASGPGTRCTALG